MTAFLTACLAYILTFFLAYLPTIILQFHLVYLRKFFVLKAWLGTLRSSACS